MSRSLSLVVVKVVGVVFASAQLALAGHGGSHGGSMSSGRSSGSPSSFKTASASTRSNVLAQPNFNPSQSSQIKFNNGNTGIAGGLSKSGGFPVKVGPQVRNLPTSQGLGKGPGSLGNVPNLGGVNKGPAGIGLNGLNKQIPPKPGQSGFAKGEPHPGDFKKYCKPGDFGKYCKPGNYGQYNCWPSGNHWNKFCYENPWFGYFCGRPWYYCEPYCYNWGYYDYGCYDYYGCYDSGYPMPY